MLTRRAFLLSLTLASLGLALPSTEEGDPGINVRQTVEAIDLLRTVPAVLPVCAVLPTFSVIPYSERCVPWLR